MRMNFSDDEYCRFLIDVFSNIFPALKIIGGAGEPFYEAPSDGPEAKLYFRSNYPRSLLHEMSHYCLAGNRRRKMDDFGYWYSPCGRSSEEQYQFELVEARPQGLEKAMCEIVGLDFLPSLDDFSGSDPSSEFLKKLDEAYIEMKTNPPPTPKKALAGLRSFFF